MSVGSLEDLAADGAALRVVDHHRTQVRDAANDNDDDRLAVGPHSEVLDGGSAKTLSVAELARMDESLSHGRRRGRKG